ncbi:MAG: hypothetical protein ACE5R4_04155 [Armatimonadota bacterium]
METRALWFDEPGPANTAATLAAARERCEALGLRDVVLASTTGKTAIAAAEAFAGSGANLVAVTLHAGLWEKYDPPDPDLVARAQSLGVKFHTATHTLLGNLGTAIREKYGGTPDADLVAYTYYTLSQGFKVAVEVVAMAADGNLIGMDADVVGIGGSSYGADTAVVMRPAYSTSFFDLKVREIICMPRKQD